MELGIARFVTPTPIRRSREDATLVSPVQSFLAEVELADRLGITFFTVGEHHSAEFIDSSPVVLLAAAAARTQHIRLSSGVTVLSANDPVRCFEDFATLDQISNGRAEMIVGRGAYAETFSLFGLDGEHYDAIFKEKLDLLLRLRANEFIRWQGRFRPVLTGQGVYPRPVQAELPIWLGVGGSPSSAVRAGTLGLPRHYWRNIRSATRDGRALPRGRCSCRPVSQSAQGLYQLHRISGRLAERGTGPLLSSL